MKTRSKSKRTAGQDTHKVDKARSSHPQSKRPKTEKSTKPKSKTAQIQINRAPCLTLWASVVAQRQGWTWDEALTAGRWVAGVLAHSKGVSQGMYEPKERTQEEREARKKRDERLGVHHVTVFGMKIPVKEVSGVKRAVSEGKPIEPKAIQTYLKRAFGEDLDSAKMAMQILADAVPVEELDKKAYHLYGQ